MLRAGIVGPAERRQVHPLQRPHAHAKGRGGELSLLHDRAQRRRRRRARRAPGAAGEDLEVRAHHSRHDRVRGHRRARPRAPRRARASATSSCSTSARSTRSWRSCAASKTRTSCTSPAHLDPSPTSRRSRPSSCSRTSRPMTRARDKLEKLARGGDKEAKESLVVADKLAAAPRRRQARPHAAAFARGGRHRAEVLSPDEQADALRLQRGRGRARDRRGVLAPRGRRQGSTPRRTWAPRPSSFPRPSRPSSPSFPRPRRRSTSPTSACPTRASPILIRAAYHLLGLRTYLTAGEKEARAWTIHAGDTAPAGRRRHPLRLRARVHQGGDRLLRRPARRRLHGRRRRRRASFARKARTTSSRTATSCSSSSMSEPVPARDRPPSGRELRERPDDRRPRRRRTSAGRSPSTRRTAGAPRQLGVDLTRLPPDPAYPDSTFVEDAAVLAPRGAHPHAARRGEPRRRSRQHRFGARALVLRIRAITAPGTLDGGDICEAGDHCFIGISQRTNKEGARQLARFLAGDGSRPPSSTSAASRGSST